MATGNPLRDLAELEAMLAVSKKTAAGFCASARHLWPDPSTLNKAMRRLREGKGGVSAATMSRARETMHFLGYVEAQWQDLGPSERLMAAALAAIVRARPNLAMRPDTAAVVAKMQRRIYIGLRPELSDDAIEAAADALAKAFGAGDISG